MSDAEKPTARVTTESLVARLMTPAAFSHPVSHLELRETYLSWVVLTGSFAYKIKKSVRLEYLDTSSLSRRRQLCEEELRLNRRLAPDIYVAVVPITDDAGGVHVGGAGEAVEYAVKMRQFNSDAELGTLLMRREVVPAEMKDLAQRLAKFHREAAVAAPDSRFPCAEHLREALMGTIATLLSHVGGREDLPELGHVVDWIHDFLADHCDALRDREFNGFVRECHGDLHARNIVRWHGRLTPFDCLEFEAKLRWIDVLNDIAFLFMDLAAQERGDLAHVFLSHYLECSGDYSGMPLLPFYAAYRALVRAMVDALASEQGTTVSAEFRQHLRSRVTVAAQFANRPRATLILMYGLSGSGKSWLSERLVGPLEAVRLRSDVERKRLGAAVQEDLYSEAFSHRTYAHLMDCAENCLKGRENVIVDAAFLRGEDRRLFRDLAAREGAGFVILACSAPPVVMRLRIDERRTARADPSDADIAVLDAQMRQIEPFAADEAPYKFSIDTTHPQVVEKALDAVRRRGTHRGSG